MSDKPKVCPTCGRKQDKTHKQRKKFHKLCELIGKELGLTPGQTKEWIKQTHFGLDEFKVGNKWVRVVQSSEDADRVQYSALIDTALREAADQGVYIPEQEWKDG